MAEYPFAAVQTTPTETELPLFKEYAWDFNNDCFIYDGNGKHILLEGNEAVKIWCYKALKTERFMYLAYTHGFGIELYPFMAKVMGVMQRKSELKRMITESLMVNPYIVKLIIVDSNMETASEHLIQQVFDHIQEKRAIGAMLTVVSAKPKPIDITAKIVGTLNSADFYQGIATYFKKLTNKILSRGVNSRKIYYVSYAQISSIIIVEGEADDHLGLRINGGMENINLDDEELPVLGTVIFT